MKRIFTALAIMAFAVAVTFLLAVEAIAHLLVYLFLGGFR